MSNAITTNDSRKTSSDKIRRLTLAALLTAVVVVLALLGTAIRFGTFNLNLALVPIVIGAAMLGVWYGAWFGFVNAVVILLSGDAAPFLAVNVAGTIVTVLAKGILAGLVSGLAYKLLEHKNKYAAVVLAALVCPLVNTGVFLIGCRIFFWDTLHTWSQGSGAGSTFAYAILFLVGTNFLIELAINVILAPAIARILGISENANVAMLIYGIVMTVLGLCFSAFAAVLLVRAILGVNPTGVANPVVRYIVMLCFSGLVLSGGVALTIVGAIRKKHAAAARK